MKRQSFPLWLLRDVPALMGFLASFWAMVIFAMTSGRGIMRTDRIGKQVRDHLALMLAHAEAKLDYALWRHAYRRLGWNPSLVRLHIIAPTILWSDTQERFANYAQAFCNMNRVVGAYVDELRERYSIAKRDVFDSSCPLRLVASRQSTSPGFAEGGKPPVSFLLRRVAPGEVDRRVFAARRRGQPQLTRPSPLSFSEIQTQPTLAHPRLRSPHRA